MSRSSTEEFLDEIDAFLRSCDEAITVDEDAPSPKDQAVDQRNLLRAEKDRKRQRRCHERQKLERETLKKQVDELSKLLEEARQRRSNTSQLSLFKTWEVIAKSHIAARHEAEKKHRLLCATVASTTDLIQELEALLKKQLGGLRLGSGQCRPQHVCRSWDSDIYAMYTQELDRLYAQTDVVFQQAGHPNPEAIWRRRGRAGGYFEFGDKRLLPFGFRQTCETLWPASHMRYRSENREHYEGVEDPENTVAFKFRVTGRLQLGTTVSIMQHAVSRRYVEADRVVIVWRSFTEGEGFFAGMNSDESGWCVLRRTLAGTEIEICARDVPMHVAMLGTSESAVEQFTGLSSPPRRRTTKKSLASWRRCIWQCEV